MVPYTLRMLFPMPIANFISDLLLMIYVYEYDDIGTSSIWSTTIYYDTFTLHLSLSL